MEGMSLLIRARLFIWEKYPWAFRKIFDRFVVPIVQEKNPK